MSKTKNMEKMLVEAMEDKFVSFGRYLLKRREEGYISAEMTYEVTDADWKNWLHEEYGEIETPAKI